MTTPPNKFAIYPGNHSSLIRDALKKRGNWEEVKYDAENVYSDTNFIWRPTNYNTSGYQKLDNAPKKSSIPTVFNHFENIGPLTSKTGLLRSLRSYYQKNEHAVKGGYTAYDTTATSFILTAGNEDNEMHAMVQRFNEIALKNYTKERMPAKHCAENMWLVKPANANQGRGIEVFRTLREILNFLEEKPLNSTWVVQKYIEKPLLYQGRKFDIRVWCLLTCKNELFFYREGYMRTSSDYYGLKNPNNYVHLTNNCLQQFGDNYGKWEDGNTLSFQVLEKFLRETFDDYDLDFERDVVQRMKDLIIDTILSVKKILNPNKRRNVYELFGYDFLIDEDMRTWLIEVNTNPYLGIPNDFIAKLLPEMIDDFLRITTDTIYPPTTFSTTRENRFDLIYCENGSTYSSTAKNLRSPFNKSLYPISEIAPGPNRPIRRVLETSPKKINIINEEETRRPALASTFGKSGESFTLPKVQNTSPRLMPTNNPEGLAKTITLLPPAEQFSYNRIERNTNRILTMLTTAETEKEIESGIQALLMACGSSLGPLLVSTENTALIAKLILTPNKPTVQRTLLNLVLKSGKHSEVQKKLANEKLVHALIELALASCDNGESEKYSKEGRFLALQCLCQLIGGFNKKVFIPGETRELNKAKNYVISCGALVATIVVNEMAIDEEIRDYLSTNLFPTLSMFEWKYQLDLLNESKVFKPVALEVQPTSTTSAPTREPTERQQVGTLPSNIFNLMDKESVVSSIETKVEDMRLENAKREQEEREQRERERQEMIRLEEVKAAKSKENQLRMEEFWKKKQEISKKLERDAARREEEERDFRLKLQEEKEKAREELKKKVDEWRKIQKLEQEKKRLEDDQTRKVMEEELKKRKELSEKAVEEWRRVKSQKTLAVLKPMRPRMMPVHSTADMSLEKTATAMAMTSAGMTSAGVSQAGGFKEGMETLPIITSTDANTKLEMARKRSSPQNLVRRDSHGTTSGVFSRFEAMGRHRLSPGRQFEEKLISRNTSEENNPIVNVLTPKQSMKKLNPLTSLLPVTTETGRNPREGNPGVGVSKQLTEQHNKKALQLLMEKGDTYSPYLENSNLKALFKQRRNAANKQRSGIRKKSPRTVEPLADDQA